MFDRIHQWTYPDLALPTWLCLSRNGSPHIGYQICGHTVVHSTLFYPFKVSVRVSLIAQECPTLCDPMNCSPPGSSVHGVFRGENTGVIRHFLLQGGLPDLGIEFMSPTLAGGFFTTEFFTTWKALNVSRTL